VKIARLAVVAGWVCCRVVAGAVVKGAGWLCGNCPRWVWWQPDDEAWPSADVVALWRAGPRI